jgi:LysM repeat protein
MKQNKIILLNLICLTIIGCASVSISKTEHIKNKRTPDYQVTKNYFLFGIIGEHTIDVNAICKENNVEKIKSQHTFQNVVFCIISLGIYFPKTAKIWCYEK